MITAGVRLEPSLSCLCMLTCNLLLSASFVLAATYLVYSRMF